MPENLIIFFVFILGATVGSFVNVCIYRLPRRLSIIYPPSHCPHCGMTLKPIDLVPLVSFLLLFGNCRHCKTPIGWRYFFVELATGLLFATAIKQYGFSLNGLLIACSLSALLIISVVDWQFFIVPDEAVWALGVFGGLYQIINKPIIEAIKQSLSGALIGAAVILAMGAFGKLLFRKEAMGFGDVKIAAATGIHLGLSWALSVYFLVSIFVGAITGIPIALYRRTVGGYIPFGPSLAFAAGLLLLYPSEVRNFVLGLYGLE